MNRITCLLLLLLSGVINISNAQSDGFSDQIYNQSGLSKLIFANSTDEAGALAKLDIQNKMAFLLLQSGNSPIVYSGDGNFETKYKIKYYDTGCTGPQREWMIAYNWQVFHFLSDKYGNSWLREVRKDVVGLRKWKWALRRKIP